MLEKPESLASPDLGAVRSSKAHRLTHIKPGFYHPADASAVCAGLALDWPASWWDCSGASGPPCVAHMRWWTTRGPRASDQDREQREILQVCAQTWRRRVLHVWDRGYAGSRLAGSRARLSAPVRRPLAQTLPSPQRTQRRGARSRLARRARAARLGVPLCSGTRGATSSVARASSPSPCGGGMTTCATQPLWLVVARRGQGQEPWYLLTSEPVTTAEQRVAHRLRLRAPLADRALAWRYGKSELALESPRVWQLGAAAKNSCSSPLSPTPSCCPCSATSRRPSGNGCCAIGVTARGSGAEKPQLRSTACARRSAVSGWRTARFRRRPSLKIRDDSCIYQSGYVRAYSGGARAYACCITSAIVTMRPSWALRSAAMTTARLRTAKAASISTGSPVRIAFAKSSISSRR